MSSIKFLNVDLGSLGSSLDENDSYSEDQINAFLSGIAGYRKENPEKRIGLVVTEAVASQLDSFLEKSNAGADASADKVLLDMFSATQDADSFREAIGAFIKDENALLVGMKGSAFPYILGKQHKDSLVGDILKAYSAQYGQGEIAPAVSAGQQSTPSSSARVMSATTPASSVASSHASNETNLIAGIKNIKKEIKVAGYHCELKFDESKVQNAEPDSIIKMEVINSADKKMLGSFDIQKEKISSHDVTIEVAIAMMQAYLQANPGADMEVQPKNQKVRQIFAEAAKVLKDQLVGIKFNIVGLNNAAINQSKADNQSAPVVQEKDKPLDPTSADVKKISADQSNSEKYYTDDEVNSLMKHYCADKKNTAISFPMMVSNIPIPAGQAAGLSDKGDVKGMDALKQNLQSMLNLRHDQNDKEYYNKEIVALPINLGVNHWALCTIKFSDKVSEPVQVNYLDPLGSKMPEKMATVIEDVLGKNANITVSTEKYQNDNYNCGPWIVELFRHLQKNDFSMSKLEEMNINQARAEHEKILYPPTAPKLR